MEAVAKHEFNATADDELSFCKGAILKILGKEDDQNWYKAEFNGKEGFVPNNYIDMKPHDWFYGRMKRNDAEDLLLQKVNNQYVHPDGAFVVRHSESAPGDFSMSVKFQEGVQHFKILRDGAGKYFLWVVKFNSIHELIEYHRRSSVSRGQTICLKDMKGTGVRKAVALYDFVPQEAGELLLKKNDELVIEEEIDRHWWRGKNMRTNESGLFPANYIRCI